MRIVEKIKWVVLPSLLVTGIGVLEIKYPHALAGFNDGYMGHGKAGLIMLIIELFFMITWGKIEGTFLIMFSLLAIVICFLPKKEQALETSVTENNKNSFTNRLSSAAFRAGKGYVQRQLRNKRSGSNS